MRCDPFTYDPLNRLTDAAGIYGTYGFTYDKAGNRQTRTIDGVTESYTYASGTNRIDQVAGPGGTVGYTYDANGNITGIDNRILTYNQNNRLVRVEEDTTILGEYAYNSLGQRVIKTVDGTVTVFHYDFDGHIIGESQTGGSFNYEYLYVDQSRFAMVDISTGSLYFYANDHLGTPFIMTDEANTMVWEADYRPFGQANVNPSSLVVNNFRFAGQYFDAETGWHYNYHRYYHPNIGRYLTPDPIGLVGGINLYAYVQNNPVNLIDPLGLISENYYHFHQVTSYDRDYGGIGSWAQPKHGGKDDWNKSLTPGQRMAFLKLTGGAAAIGGGALQRKPKMIYGGITIVADGMVQGLIEAMGGDSQKIPLPIEIYFKIGKGFVDGVKNNNELECDKLSSAGYEYWR